MSGDGEGRVVTRRDGDVVLIGLDRPAKLNGFTPRMIREYAHALTAFDQDETARCAVLYAEGRHFTAGLDLPKFTELWARGESVYPDDTLDIFDLTPPYRKKPLVAAVQGITYTIGIELMLTADCVIAAEDCRFRQHEAMRGIIAAGGATIRMVQRAGWGNAMRYLLTGDEFDSAAALRCGFVQDVVPVGEQLPRALALAHRIATQAAPLAVIATRANARVAMEQRTEAALAHLATVHLDLQVTEDAKEGVRSFVEKRPPRFTGR